MRRRCPLVIALLGVLLAACSRHAHEATTVPGIAPGGDAAFEQRLQRQLLDAHPGVVIEIPAGTHPLQHTLTVRAHGVTLRGAGPERSILSFQKSAAGTAGIVVYGNGFMIEGVAIEDSKGEALVIHGGENITVRAVRVAWSGGPQRANGPYGIHFEGSRNVLIEDCAAYSAAGAGIYLVQSLNVIVRRCHAEQDTAGIALANTVGGDLEDNIATGDSSGIVIFNTPGTTPAGHAVRVFRNHVFKNNLGNFAPGGIVAASVPSGCGVLLNAVTEIEIFDNDIADNQTANVVVSAHFLGRPAAGAEPAGPYPRAIHIYDNRFAGGGNDPAVAELKALRVTQFGPSGRLPEVIWDGYGDPGTTAKGRASAAPGICLANGNARLLDADARDEYRHPLIDPSSLRCRLPKLAPVVLPAAAP